jgi:beta-phosphoglucomutase family hydrolase
MKQEKRLRAAVFDLDGVVTDTAQIHFQAWKRTFEALLHVTFTYDDDYVPYVDGKPRYDGVASYLQSRGVDLPRGDASDDPGENTVCAVGNRKNQLFREIVSAGEIPIFESTIDFVDGLVERDVAVGVASSSRNCRFVLESTGLIDRFPVVVDGTTSRELGLRGKPEPDIFLTAARRLGAVPSDSLMVEDAYAGVEAGRRGGFGLVVGVARDGDVAGLRDRGADVVVSDLRELTVETALEWFA